MTTQMVSVRSATRAALRIGFDPYDNHSAIARAWTQIARKRGAS